MSEAMTPRNYLTLFEQLTLLTFFLGLLFAIGQKWWELARERKNVRTVLRRAAALYNAALNILDKEAGVENNDLVVRQCSDIDLALWDSNLARIHLLTSDEVEDFITIYWALHSLVNSARDYVDSTPSGTSSRFPTAWELAGRLRGFALKTRALLRDYLDGRSGKDLVWTEGES